MKKLAIVITNRSSYNRVKTVIRNLPGHVCPYLILGSSAYLYKYGNVYKNIKRDFPDITVIGINMAVEGNNLPKMPKTVGVGVIELTTVFETLKPDAVITIADRFETMATAIAASYLNIPLIHIQGGEISGTIDNKVRNAVTQLADYHFPATNSALNEILRSKRGAIWRDHAWNFGCPSMDTLVTYDEARLFRSFGDSGILTTVTKNMLNIAINSHGTGYTIDFDRPYLIVMLHPDTVNPITVTQLGAFMELLRTAPAQKIIFWNNIDPGGEEIAKALRVNHELDNDIEVNRYIRHVEPEDFGLLLAASSCIIGNSSAGIREATFMGTPSVTVGTRQNGRECGNNVIRSSMEFDDMFSYLNTQFKSSYQPNDMFGNGDAGETIANKIGMILYDN